MEEDIFVQESGGSRCPRRRLARSAVWTRVRVQTAPP
jgi:hypothetical protein